jgi:hypothetical protein
MDSEHQQVQVHPLLGCAFFVDPNNPEIVIMQFKTKAGLFPVGATRELLQQLGDVFRAQAFRMSRDQETNIGDDDSFHF